MDKFTKYSLLFIIITLPLQVFSIYLGFSLLLVRVIFLTSMLIYIFRGLQRGHIKIPQTFLDLNILFLVIINFIISVFAIDILLSIKDALLQILVIFFFYYCIQLLDAERSINFAIKIYINTAMIISLYGIFQQIGFILGWDTNLPFIEYFSYHDASKDPSGRFWAEQDIGSFFIRIKGTFLDTNLFAGYIVSVLGLIIAKLIYAYHHNIANAKIKYLFLFLFFNITLFMTMSRSALVGYSILLLVVLYYFRKEILHKFILIKIIFSIGIFLTIVIMTIPDLYDLIMSVFESLIFSDKLMVRSQSAKLHLHIALEGIQMFFENPLTGIGLNNFRIEYAHNNTVWIKGFTSKSMMAHSIFISFLAEGGIIGTCANLSLISVIIYYTNKKIKRITSIKKKALIVGTFSSYIGVLGCNIFYQFYLMEFVWFLLALNISVINILNNSIHSNT